MSILVLLYWIMYLVVAPKTFVKTSRVDSGILGEGLNGLKDSRQTSEDALL